MYLIHVEAILTPGHADMKNHLPKYEILIFPYM